MRGNATPPLGAEAYGSLKTHEKNKQTRMIDALVDD
jgi:hypothetical protein